MPNIGFDDYFIRAERWQEVAQRLNRHILRSLSECIELFPKSQAKLAFDLFLNYPPFTLQTPDEEMPTDGLVVTLFDVRTKTVAAMMLGSQAASRLLAGEPFSDEPVDMLPFAFAYVMALSKIPDEDKTTAQALPFVLMKELKPSPRAEDLHGDDQPYRSNLRLWGHEED